MVASSNAVSDPEGSRRLGHASIGLSVAGIVVTIVIIIVVVAVVTSRVKSAVDSYSPSSCPSYYYNINGVCYKSRSYTSSYYCSRGVRSGSYCYYNIY